MKSVIFAFTVLCLSSAGCGGSTSSPNQPPLGISPAPPMQKKEPDVVIDPAYRIYSNEFFMALRLTDTRQSIELIDSRTLAPNSSIYPDGVYRATSPIRLGSVIPDEIEISFPLPPEVSEASDDTVQVHYGCGGDRAGDVYPIRAQATGLNFTVMEGIPRGTISSDGLRPMFRLCSGRYVTVAVAFYGRDSRAHVWEQVYLSQEEKKP
jgi:hypothetical protein